MTLTEIFKTSFETVKAHKTPFITVYLLNVVIQVVLYCIPDFHFLLARTLYTFLATFLYLLFFFILKGYKVSKKELFSRIPSLAFISLTSNVLYTILNKLLLLIGKLSAEYSDFYNSLKLFILPAYIIIWIIIEVFGMYAVAETETLLKAIKLVCEKMKSNFVKTISEALIIYLIVFLPIFAMSIREILVYQEIQNSLFMKIIIIPPLNLFYLICIFNYCTKKL